MLGNLGELERAAMEVLWDHGSPMLVRDVSTYEDPHHFSEGVTHVIVNGTPVLRGGKMTGELPGRVLRRVSAR